MRRAARGEEAGANHGDLRPWSRAAHLAAEQAVAGRNARDVRSVGAGNDADADEPFRRVCLHDEWNRLAHRRRGVVVPEVADVVVDLVVGHERLVGEAEVVVRVDQHLVVGVTPEHREEVAARAVAVEIGAAADAVLAACAEQVLPHAGNVVRPVLRDSGVVERRATEHEVELTADDSRVPGPKPPRRVAVRERIGVGDPVDDLALTRARDVHARMVEIDASVEDADRHAAAVPRVVMVDELRRTRVTRGHVGVDARRVRAGRRLRVDGLLAVRERIGQRNHGVEVDRLDAPQARCLIGLPDRHVDADVAKFVVAISDLAADLAEVLCDRCSAAGVE